jgi:NAD+ diphosphatase
MQWREFSGLGLTIERTHSIGHVQGVAHFAAALPDDTAIDSLPEPFKAQNLRNWFGQLPEEQLTLAMRAVQLLEWDRTHRFCGACATPTSLMPGERAKRCPACELAVYPRISPAMMALVLRGDEMLLARGVNFPPGRYSALAGFLEAGESVEDAVHREVFEEVGLRVNNLQYFASQSWPFPNSLMIAFTAEYESGDLTPDPKEIADAQWFRFDQLPQLPPRFSISRALVEFALQRARR